LFQNEGLPDNNTLLFSYVLSVLKYFASDAFELGPNFVGDRLMLGVLSGRTRSLTFFLDVFVVSIKCNSFASVILIGNGLEMVLFFVRQHFLVHGLINTTFLTAAFEYMLFDSCYVHAMVSLVNDMNPAFMFKL
jgi:hypothetical protein